MVCIQIITGQRQNFKESEKIFLLQRKLKHIRICTTQLNKAQGSIYSIKCLYEQRRKFSNQ